MYQGSACECFAQQRAVHTFGSNLGDFYWSDNEERRMNTLEGYHNHDKARSKKLLSKYRAKELLCVVGRVTHMRNAFRVVVDVVALLSVSISIT
jgi:hypothetical protein